MCRALVETLDELSYLVSTGASYILSAGMHRVRVYAYTVGADDKFTWHEHWKYDPQFQPDNVLLVRDTFALLSFWRSAFEIIHVPTRQILTRVYHMSLSFFFLFPHPFIHWCGTNESRSSQYLVGALPGPPSYAVLKHNQVISVLPLTPELADEKAEIRAIEMVVRGERTSMEMCSDVHVVVPGTFLVATVSHVSNTRSVTVMVHTAPVIICHQY